MSFHLSRSQGSARTRGWWARQDSNLGPTDYESAALPLSYGPGAISNILHREGMASIDRFAGSPYELVNAVSDLDALGIQFVSPHQGVDTSTPSGRLVFGIFARITEFERELIRECLRWGLAAARALGQRLGRPRRTVDAARIAALREQWLGWKKIAAALGVGVGTVCRIAQNCPSTPSETAAAD